MKFFRDPLFHFILAGLIIFAAYWIVQGQRANDERTIKVSTADMERMAALYAAEAGTLPSPQDIHAMVADHVRNEALSREARRLGLDQGDTVVERRLAQKMTFMISDLNDDEDVSEETLRNWYTDHSRDFSRPAHMTFQNVFFSKPDTARIDSTLNALNSASSPEWKEVGDPFMLQRQYADLPAREVARVFGTDFAKALFNLQVSDAWQGPVQSSLGTFLIRVQSRTPAELPSFEAVRSEVRASYLEANRRTQNERAIAELVSSYKVEIEGVTP